MIRDFNCGVQADICNPEFMRDFKQVTWHGLSWAQWVQLGNTKGWAHEVDRALREVATCRHAAAHDRLLAIQALNEGLVSGYLPADPGFASYMYDVLLDVTILGERGWFTRRIRRHMRAKLAGARWLLNTAGQFVTNAEAERTSTGAESAADARMLS